MAAVWVKLYINTVMTLIICPALRLYWFMRPQRRCLNEKVIRFCDVVSLMAFTLLLGRWLGGWAFHGSLALLALMYWREQTRRTRNHQSPCPGH